MMNLFKERTLWLTESLYIWKCPDSSQDTLTAYNSTYPKGGVSCSKDSFVVNQTLVFQIKFCGKNTALRVAANRYRQP